MAQQVFHPQLSEWGQVLFPVERWVQTPIQVENWICRLPVAQSAEVEQLGVDLLLSVSHPSS